MNVHMYERMHVRMSTCDTSKNTICSLCRELHIVPIPMEWVVEERQAHVTSEEVDGRSPTEKEEF